MASRILGFVVICAILAACGGGGGGDDPIPQSVQPVVVPMTRLVVIGNSLTIYGSAIPEQGWFGSWGMAASAADKDFAHLTAAAVGLPLVLRAGADVELHPVDAMAELEQLAAGVDSASLVVVELADNARAPLGPFQTTYAALLDRVKQARRLVCVGTWWPDADKDAMVRTECEKRGGRFVFIGDLQYSPDNLDTLGYQFPGQAVNEHPHDWGMAQIGQRVVAALR